MWVPCKGIRKKTTSDCVMSDTWCNKYITSIRAGEREREREGGGGGGGVSRVTYPGPQGIVGSQIVF